MNRNTKTALIWGGAILGLLLIISLIGGGLAGWQSGGWGMMGPGMMGGFGWGGFMGIWMLLFWVLVILAVVALVRGAAGSGGAGTTSQPADSPLDVLKKRYARGEVSKEEYEEKKSDLV